MSNVLFNVIAIASTTSLISNNVSTAPDAKTHFINTLLIWTTTAVVIPLLSFVLRKVKRWLKSKGFKDDEILKLELELKNQLYDGLLLVRDEAVLKGQGKEIIDAIDKQLIELDENIKKIETMLSKNKEGNK